jgi:hypothetical protein
MSETQEETATLSDDDIETRRVGVIESHTDDTTDTGDDTGDDSGDVSDTSDTGDDSGDDSAAFR